MSYYITYYTIRPPVLYGGRGGQPGRHTLRGLHACHVGPLREPRVRYDYYTITILLLLLLLLLLPITTNFKLLLLLPYYYYYYYY